MLRLEAGGGGVADLAGRPGVLLGLFGGLGDAGRGVVLAEELAHEAGRDDGGEGVGDTLAGDVGCGAVYRLEHRRTRPGRVEVGAGSEADAAGDRAAEV